MRKSVGDDDVSVVQTPNQCVSDSVFNVLHVVEQQLVVGDNFYVGAFCQLGLDGLHTVRQTYEFFVVLCHAYAHARPLILQGVFVEFALFGVISASDGFHVGGRVQLLFYHLHVFLQVTEGHADGSQFDGAFADGFYLMFVIGSLVVGFVFRSMKGLDSSLRSFFVALLTVAFKLSTCTLNGRLQLGYDFLKQGF